MNARRASRAQQPPARKRGFHAAPPASHQIIRTIAVQVSEPAIPSQRRAAIPRTPRPPPNHPRINVRSIDRSGGGFAAVDIAAVRWQMCQRSAQPSSCRNQSDLFQSAVQHGDGWRRRLSIRQTRSPKQARGFWCLFLKKARPICDGTPRPRTPRFFFPSFVPTPSAILLSAIRSPRFYSPRRS